MRIYSIILVFAAMLISAVATSQNIQTATIEWNCNSTFIARPGTTTEEITKVVSSSDQVIWYDSAGLVKKSFSITDTNGSWSNVSSNGSINFIVNGDDAGMVQFIRSEGIAKIRIHIITEDDSQIYELVVSNQHTL